MVQEYKMEFSENKVLVKRHYIHHLDHKTGEPVWFDDHGYFDNITDALNYIIKESWEKKKEGIQIRSLGEGEKQLPQNQRDLVQRITDAYNKLESIQRIMEDKAPRHK